MVIGQALEMSGVSSSLEAMVSPHWWAGDLIASSSTGALFQDKLMLISPDQATVASTTVSSPEFSLRGSAWDAASSQAISSSFSLTNDVSSPTSSLFTLGYSSGTDPASLLTITNLGDVSVKGDLTVGRRLYLGSAASGLGSTSTYIYVDDTLAPSLTYISTNADGWSTSSTYDYAERYVSDDKLEAGELVTADANGVNKVRRITSTKDPILGVVSTRPGFITGRNTQGSYPIALAGRVPIKVSTKNGAIKAGDYLTSSDIAGVAMKAVSPGEVIGIALEAYDKADMGSVSVFVKPGWQALSLASDGSSSSATASSASQTSNTSSADKRSGLAKIYAGSTEVKVSFPTLNAYPLIQATPYGEAKGGYWLTGISDTGFTIVLGQAPSFDLVFAWTAEASVSGNVMSFSDNTWAPYDPTSGLIVGPSPVQPASASSSSSTASTADSVQPDSASSSSSTASMVTSTE